MTKEFQLNKREYRLLLDFLAIADWIMNSIDIEPHPKSRPYRKILQKFYAMAEEFGYGDLIEYAPEMKEYTFTAKMGFEEDWIDWVDRFTEDAFWDELVQRLAEIHLIRKLDVEKLKTMSRETWLNLLGEAEEKYANEFVENGLENVYVLGIEEIPQAETPLN